MKGNAMSASDDRRKAEIIRLQSEVIRQLAGDNLRRVGEDLWGMPPAKNEPDLPDTPPAGYPPVPDVFGTDNAAAEEKKAEEAPASPPRENIEDLREELHSYIGLDLIKQEVDSLINLVTVYNLRRQHNLPCEDLSLHMVFSGNPGTGKTMVARLMSRIYHALGILSKGHLVEVDRSGLVAGYVGQTAIKTQEAVQKALGGVLFIDEAYALTTRGMNDYGQEAVETLLKAMEDHRDDLIVIVAGYAELMDAFIHANPGLESRFNRFMHFPDYTVDEMMAIFIMRGDKAGYVLAENAKEPLRKIIEQASADNISFGNARGVRNLFEQAVSRQANRLAGQPDVTREQLMLITAVDLPGGEASPPAQADAPNSAGEDGRA